MKKPVTVIIEASTTGYGAYSEKLPGVTGYGKTIEAAKEDLKEAIQSLLEFHQEEGTTPPKFLNNGNIEFVYKLDLATIFEHFPMIDASNFAKSIGLNASLMRQYKTHKAEASPKQKKKIVEGLHRLGRELLAIEA